MEGDTKEKMSHVPTSPLTQRPRSGLVCAYAHASLWLRTPNFDSAELLSAQAWLAWCIFLRTSSQVCLHVGENAVSKDAFSWVGSVPQAAVSAIIRQCTRIMRRTRCTPPLCTHLCNNLTQVIIFVLLCV